MQSSVEQYKQKIEADLGETNFLRVAQSMFNYLVDMQNKEQDHIPYSRFKKIVVKESSDEEIDQKVFGAAQYFCGERTHLLNMKFEFIDENDNCWPIEVEQALHALESKYFIHPETGFEIEDASQSIFMFFSTSSELRNIHER
jgi:hypothetical protein